MGRHGRKRTHANYNQDSARGHAIDGVGATLAGLQASQIKIDTSTPRTDQDSDDWETVDHKSKRRKHENGSREPTVSVEQKRNDQRPALTFAELHKLQSSVKLSDLQSLVLYCLADGTSPQWISVRHHGHIRKAVVLLVPGLEKDMFTGHLQLEDSNDDGDVDQPPPGIGGESANSGSELTRSHDGNLQGAAHPSNQSKTPDDYLPLRLNAASLPSPLKPLADIFEHVWPVKSPGDDKYFKVHSPLHAMLSAPIPKTQEEKRAEKTSKGAQAVKERDDWINERTAITAFLVSPEDLRESEYTLHPASLNNEQEIEFEMERRMKSQTTNGTDWADTKVDKLEDGNVDASDIEQDSVTAGRTVLALDCEMCKVENDELALTRISIVDWDGEIAMDEYVKPDKPIVDYLTRYSGITPAHLEAVTTTLSDIRSRLLSLITPKTILVGHSLNSDLDALKMTHPFIIDTSILYPHPRGPPLKSSLKWLAQKYLSREIQRGHGATGHDSIEDARACLDLVKKKCEKGPRWGNPEAERESIFKRLARTPRSASNGVVGAGPREGKTGAIVDYGNPERTFGSMTSVCIACSTDEDVVEGVRRAVLGDADGAVVPGGGVDLTWARLRGLEYVRGWRMEQGDGRDDAGGGDPSPGELGAAVAASVACIAEVRRSLPACSLLLVYSGTGDVRELVRLQQLQRTFRAEYQTRRWDELSVRWTDTEEQALRRACSRARAGVAFVCVT